MGDYDRNRALFDGRTQIDGCDPVYMLLSPEEMFFRAMRSQDFDITELSFSSYLVKHSRGDCPYIAVPVFLSRAFRHTSIYVRRDRIKRPEDLAGKRIGIPEYQLTAIVWARSILQDDHGIAPEDVTWVRQI
jgi:4,5-dihydroxyphthalate decarboxylase